MAQLLSDQQVIERIFHHIDNQSTDEGEHLWREPTQNYVSQSRFQQERQLLRQLPVAFCPSSVVANVGDYVARTAAGVPIVVVRGEDGAVRAFRNACRHRGMQVATGEGCAKVLSCTYHGWTYRLDGRLEYIPHDRGFPGIEKDAYSLVPVFALESHGLIFVSQDAPIDEDFANDLPPLISDDQKVFASMESGDQINWKLNVEAAIEGYHIKPTHKETFYPYGYDNLNVVERFGKNSRVTYPFRRIEKLRDTPPGERQIDGMVTYVYHLFPNVVIAVLSDHTTMTINEPVSPHETRFFTYRLSNKAKTMSEDQVARAKRDAQFVSDSGGKEDQAVVRAIQAGLDSGANEHFTYGRFEKAIAHFHTTLTDELPG
ncbi:MAG: phenylpropionate dioxygenase-like ring-hydroxylating dioxygenase large terminal subunit [Limisphaerales bacterium]